MDETSATIHEDVWQAAAPHWAGNEAFGHGADHAHRVRVHGLELAASTGASVLAVGAACYLMDAGLSVRDGRPGHIERSLEIAERIIRQVPALQPVAPLILDAIRFHEAEDVPPSNAPIEALVVRDSDTLDRLGTTGIRMTIQYGRWVGRDACHLTDPLCLNRAPCLDGYTLDYVRYLASLHGTLSTDAARSIAHRKENEERRFWEAVGLGRQTGARIDHDWLEHAAVFLETKTM